MFGPVLRIRDVYPGSWFLPIPDPGSKNSNKRQGWKFFFVKPFFVVTNFTKLNIILFLIWRKKFGPIFQELLKFLPKKLSPSPPKYGIGIRDPGSEIREPETTYSGSRIPDPGVKKAPDPRSGSATLVEAWIFYFKIFFLVPYGTYIDLQTRRYLYCLGTGT